MFIDIPLSEYLLIWLNEYKQGTIRKNTFVLHKRNIEKQIIPFFGRILLEKVKPIMYQKFLNQLFDKGYSKRSVELVHSTMHNAMSRAVTLGKIEKNPCIGATIKGQQKVQTLKFMESKDIPFFLQQTYQYNYIYWIYFKLLIETGMRKGEAAALQWSDIDLKQMTISINKTLDFSAMDRRELFGDTKTYHSVRTIHISKNLVNDLINHVKYQNQNKLALNDLYHHDLNLVLCRNDGSFIPKSSLFNAFSRILTRAGIPSMPIHSLRHTHAVLLLETGVDMKYIQERLGHGSLRITSDVYAHISKKIETDSISKFEEYMQNIYD
ncbi:site-specific integrase [Brevibacillus laterosporus]|uniref:site-specific integrase n=1 Tax=Brevibacillus laterosporus TaxID=1465 RepID=UPI000CE3DE44|nr:site-specific integrase [Brevibacillus laterosporus]PPA87097.1 site-specific integrase [Brevibacillus laterosporus]